MKASAGDRISCTNMNETKTETRVDRPDRRILGLVLATVLDHQAHRALPEFPRVLLRHEDHPSKIGSLHRTRGGSPHVRLAPHDAGDRDAILLAGGATGGQFAPSHNCQKSHRSR